MKHRIPKIIHQVWVGPKEKPEWIDVWKEKHPDWEHVLWDDERVANTEWLNQKHLDFFREAGKYHGMADVLRYEIIYRHGGIAIPGDEEFVSTLEPLLKHEIFTVYECEKVYGDRLTPIIGAEKGHDLLFKTIKELHHRKMGEPWVTSGNMFWTEMCEGEKIDILPAYTFLPEHHMGYKYEGDGRIYGRQRFGTTKGLY